MVVTMILDKNTLRSLIMKYLDRKQSPTLGSMVQSMSPFNIISHIGYEYRWIYPTAAFKCNCSSNAELEVATNGLPNNIQSIVEEFTKNNNNSYKRVNLYIVNYNAKEFKNDFLVDKNMTRVRLNFAPHAFLF